MSTQLHLNKNVLDARNLIFNDKSRRWRKGKEVSLVCFFFIRKYLAIHFSLKWERKCSVMSAIFSIFTMDLTMWWLLKIFQFLIEICFFFSFFLSFFFIYLHSTEHRPHSWELCENSWNFRSFFFSTSLSTKRNTRINVTQTI